jgi:hypothetical protein
MSLPYTHIVPEPLASQLVEIIYRELVGRLQPVAFEIQRVCRRFTLSERRARLDNRRSHAREVRAKLIRIRHQIALRSKRVADFLVQALLRKEIDLQGRNKLVAKELHRLCVEDLDLGGDGDPVLVRLSDSHALTISMHRATSASYPTWRKYLSAVVWLARFGARSIQGVYLICVSLPLARPRGKPS